MKINELELPCSLERDLETGLWPPTDCAAAAFATLFNRLDSPLLRLYELEGIKFENEEWQSSSEDFYLGIPNDSHFPGNVERDKTLIIGSAEPDSPIALDYRVDPPRVVYLGDADGQTYWFELAPSYDALAAMFGIAR